VSTDKFNHLSRSPARIISACSLKYRDRLFAKLNTHNVGYRIHCWTSQQWHPALVESAQVTLPPKNVRSLVLMSMLFIAHENEIRSVIPPAQLDAAIAFFGKRLGYKLPP
jgi:hypothetical protein